MVYGPKTIRSPDKGLTSPVKSRFEKPLLNKNGFPEIKKTPSIWDEVSTYYHIDKKIGNGTYGSVYAAK